MGSVTVTASADVLPTGLAATGGVGSVEIGIFVTVPVTAPDPALGQVGVAEAQLAVDVNVTGVSATGFVSGVLVYGNIVPDQNPGYTNETPSQSPAWSEETPSQNASWTRIAA
jgi:hypothetical protein